MIHDLSPDDQSNFDSCKKNNFMHMSLKMHDRRLIKTHGQQSMIKVTCPDTPPLMV